MRFVQMIENLTGHDSDVVEPGGLMRAKVDI
jgi:hypothetical protein